MKFLRTKPATVYEETVADETTHSQPVMLALAAVSTNLKHGNVSSITHRKNIRRFLLKDRPARKV